MNSAVRRRIKRRRSKLIRSVVLWLIVILTACGLFYQLDRVCVMQVDTLDKLNEIDIQVSYVPVYEEYTFTGYCGCEICCGEWAKNRGEVVTGAAGTELIPGYSCANNVFPLGTILTSADGTQYRVDDRTAKFVNDKYNGKIIDVYFADHESALKFGKQIVWVEVI